MDKDVEEDVIQSVHDDEHKLVDVEKTLRVTEKLLQSTTTIAEDVVEDFQIDFGQVKEHKEITTTDWVQEITMDDNVIIEEVLITNETQQTATKMGEEDVDEEHLEADFILAEKQKTVTTADEEPIIAGIDSEIEEEEMVNEIIEEIPQSMGTMVDCVHEGFHEVDVHVVELTKLVTADDVLEVTKTEDEDARKENAFTGDITSELDVARDCVQEGYFENDVHVDELTKVVTVDNVVEVTETEDEDARKENAFTGDRTSELDFARDRVQEGYFENDVHVDELTKVVAANNVLEVTETADEDVWKENENVFAGDLASELDVAREDYNTSSVLDDVIESLSKITITEPTTSINDDIPLCKNNNEKNTAEPVCKNSSEKNNDEPVREDKIEENTAEAEPAAMQENKVVKVTNKSAELYRLSLAQLRAKRKEAKRVALARVDENVCRSNATEQEQVWKLQQY